MGRVDRYIRGKGRKVFLVFLAMLASGWAVFEFMFK